MWGAVFSILRMAATAGVVSGVMAYFTGANNPEKPYNDPTTQKFSLKLFWTDLPLFVKVLLWSVLIYVIWGLITPLLPKHMQRPIKNQYERANSR